LVQRRALKTPHEKSESENLAQRSQSKSGEETEKAELLSARFSRVDSLTLGCGWFFGGCRIWHDWLSEELRQEFGRQRRIEIIRDYNKAAVHAEGANGA
jgi:hypothetical protein